MKIYVIGSDRRIASNVVLYKKIAESLKSLGHNIDMSWVQSTTESDSSNFEQAYRRNMNSIKNADVIVAEISNITSGVGFLLSAAMNLKKPVLALFNKDLNATPSTTLKGSALSNKLVHYTNYDLTTLPEIATKHLNKIKQQLDTKFILIISPEIDRYLEWVGENRRMHKAQVVRSAVEEAMKKDKEYKEYLKSV